VVSGEVSELLARAEAYLIAGNADAAFASAQEAGACAGPAHVPSRLVAARALLASGRPDEAEAVLLSVLGTDAVHAPARRLLGLALAAQGRFDEAVESWDHWSRLDTRAAEEDALGSWVSRLRSASELLGRAVRASHE
jgi:tetratricopeptide (TPR) repeat protein